MEQAPPRRFVLLGPPASGKGTQGRKLAAALDLAYLSTGALLREHVESATPLGKQAAPVLARGGYLPDALMNPIIGDWVEKQTAGWVLDGFPRSLPQAEFLKETLASAGAVLDAAILLDVPFPVLLDRITDRRECPECRWSGSVSSLKNGDQCPQCGSTALPRADDNEENFRRRFHEYTTHTQPLADWYESSGLLVRCDATDEPDVVSRRLREAVTFKNTPVPFA